MTELTLNTGFMGSSTTINIDWFDHNNVRYLDKVEIRIKDQDKPRVLQILVNDMIVATRESR